MSLYVRMSGVWDSLQHAYARLHLQEVLDAALCDVTVVTTRYAAHTPMCAHPKHGRLHHSGSNNSQGTGSCWVVCCVTILCCDNSSRVVPCMLMHQLTNVFILMMQRGTHRAPPITDFLEDSDVHLIDAHKIPCNKYALCLNDLSHSLASRRLYVSCKSITIMHCLPHVDLKISLTDATLGGHVTSADASTTHSLQASVSTEMRTLTILLCTPEEYADSAASTWSHYCRLRLLGSWWWRPDVQQLSTVLRRLYQEKLNGGRVSAWIFHDEDRVVHTHR